MYDLLLIYLIFALTLTWRGKGPVWVCILVWIICVMPLQLGVIDFPLASESRSRLVVAVLIYLSLFLTGSALTSDGRNLAYRRIEIRSIEFLVTKRVARYLWWAGIASIVCVIADFYVSDIGSLDNLVALRERYVVREGTAFTKIASVTSWATLYCALYAVWYRKRMSKTSVIWYFVPAAGYFLTSLLSAGRQNAFQLMLIAIVVYCVFPTVKNKSNVKSLGSLFAVAAISSGMIIYMGYVAVMRNDGSISSDKAEVLKTIFGFEIEPQFDLLLMSIGSEFRSTTIEAIAYFSTSIVLFGNFLELDMDRRFFGAMTFPFVLRQLQPLTGVSVLEALQTKVDWMYGLGVMGNGWTGALSSNIMDFGYIGAGLYVFALGYYSALRWRIYKSDAAFNSGVVCVTLILNCIYMPFLAGTAETNLLMLFMFSTAMRMSIERRGSTFSST